jgi:hypothetical protein
LKQILAQEYIEAAQYFMLELLKVFRVNEWNKMINFEQKIIWS